MKKVIFAGDVHGHLNKFYKRVGPINPDLILQLGDMCTIRNEEELISVSAPNKYRRMGDYPDYNTGKKNISFPTAFIAGNHENAAMLQEHLEGFELVNNLYYLGRYGNKSLNEIGKDLGVEINSDIRIAWLSGVYGQNSFSTPLHKVEAPKYYAKKSAFHFRNFEINNLSKIGKADILMLHQLPATLQQHYINTGKLCLRSEKDRLCEELDIIILEMEVKQVIIGHLHFEDDVTIDGVRYILLTDVESEEKFSAKLNLDTGRIE
jgi:lariat debranching enzyme